MTGTARINEIDALRGIAILMMVIFHIIFDLTYYYGWSFNYTEGFWYYEGKASAVLFMLISGISMNLSHSASRRGLKVLGAGFVITIISYLLIPSAYIQFGILHLLGFSMLISPYLTRLSPFTLIALSIAIMSSSPWLSVITIENSYLLPLGITPTGFTSLDYYPLSPWLGVVVLGISAGKLLYAQKQTYQPLISSSNLLQGLIYLGRNSLIIYLLHQPFILGLLYLLHKK